MATTWTDDLKSAAGLSLSGGNLTATATAAASVGASRNCTGKTYFQVTLGSSIGTAQFVGLVTRSFAFGTTLLGTDAALNSIGYRSSDGTVKAGNATLSTIQTSAANAVVDVAFDPIARLIWFRTNNGNWNNSGAADPATGAGGISTATVGGPLYPAWGAAATGNNATAVFTSGFTNTAPASFVTVDTNQAASFNGAVANRAAAFSTYGPAFSASVPAAAVVTSIPPGHWRAYPSAVAASTPRSWAY